MKALFLSHQHALAPGGGGQQQCTREYQETLRVAGFDLVNVTFDTDQLWRTRLRRKFRPAPYANLVPKEFFARVDKAIAEYHPTFVFCNLCNFVPLGPRLRRVLPADSRLVLLSHGLESVDELHTARITRQPFAAPHMPQITDEWLGRIMCVERDGLSAFDHVFCLAAFEVEICRWFGVRSVSWLPRIMRLNQALDWKPTGDRVGILGTIDHPPNLEGAELFCASLQAAGVGSLRLRLVTRSQKFAADLRARYPFVDDLGPLETPRAVEAEAATWSAFIHPIFCYARGCSTKVATGLNWGLPVLTSAAGLRGYAWKQGELPILNSAQELAGAALGSLKFARANALHEEVLKVVRSAPTLNEVAAQVRRDLGLA